MTTTPQAALLREAAQNALTTLDGIANANPRDKDDFDSPDEWIAWAKSRARWAADALREPVAREVYAERILKQMLHEASEPQAEKKCGTCGFIGQEDPVKGCPKCGFDDMQDKLQATQEPVQAGELPGAPERIWLQVNPEGDASDTGYPADHEDVTWCWHSIGGQEVEYVRADRAALSARKPLSGHEARELVSIHQKAVFELAKDMSDDNHKAVVSARLALLHELCPNGIGLEVKP